MLEILEKIFKSNNQKEKLNEAAKLLQVSPELLQRFETDYQALIRDYVKEEGDLFSVSAAEAKDMTRNTAEKEGEDLKRRIIKELIASMTPQDILRVRNGKVIPEYLQLPEVSAEPVTAEELKAISQPSQMPQLTGNLIQRDINDSMPYVMLLDMYRKWKEGKPHAYNLFRQGLDILDLDPVIYEMLGMNRCNMGYWLPKITGAAGQTGFFKIPDTTVIKVPLPMLQLTRLGYETLTPMTKAIVNGFCERIFELDTSKEYFVKNGVFSSKFDFRNCHVAGEQEVRELGEYLLYIHTLATTMAGPLSSPCIYGAATTNEWVVREYIPDTEKNPCIYKGLPLRTEYRLFVDFDTDEVLAVAPYWDPELMKKRFSEHSDADSPHIMHDYIIIQTRETDMMEKFRSNADRLCGEMDRIIPYVGLEGQWSVDIMQNGEEFWLIDMAPAEQSALYEYVPEEKRRSVEENWIPKLDSREVDTHV